MKRIIPTSIAFFVLGLLSYHFLIEQYYNHVSDENEKTIRILKSKNMGETNVIGILSPTIPPHLSEWKLYQRNMVNSEYAFEVLEDGFKLIQVEVQKPYGSKIVMWGWRMKIRNKSDHKIGVNIHYKLRDIDDFLITTDKSLDNHFNSGEIKIIQSSSFFNYKDINRVYSSTWWAGNYQVF